jgi:hypothetical protein
VEGRRRAQNFARLLYINNQKFKVTGPKEGGGKGSIKKNYNCKARPLPRGALMTCPKTKTSHIKPAMLLCVCARTHARERERGERERERERRERRESERGERHFLGRHLGLSLGPRDLKGRLALGGLIHE